MNRYDVFRRATSGRWWLWAIPLALLVVNLGVFIYYQVGYAGQVGQMQGQLESEMSERQRVVTQRESLEELVRRAQSGRDGIESLYIDRFSTESLRLTDLIREVKDLAKKSGLQPAESISYPEEEIEDYGLLKRSLVFSVQGTYPQLRQFVNLLELSETFVVLERVNVAGTSPTLNVSLDISTLFAGRDRAVRREERPPSRRSRRNA